MEKPTWEECIDLLDVISMKSRVDRLVRRYGIEKRGYSADDVMCDLLYLTWERFDQFNPEIGVFEAWVWNWAKSICNQLYRYGLHFVSPIDEELDILDIIPDPSPQPLEVILDSAEQTESMRRIRIIKAVLRTGDYQGIEQDRAVFDTYLRLLHTERPGQKVSQDVVASHIGITQQAVSKSLSRIRERCSFVGLGVSF